LLSWHAAAAAQEVEFVVDKGYLSASVAELAESWGWSLVWQADEDRIVDHAFGIENDSLRTALEKLLGMYDGEFVADLFQTNRVVLVGVPPPQVDVVMPGEEIEPDDEEATAADVVQPTEVASSPRPEPTTPSTADEAGA